MKSLLVAILSVASLGMTFSAQADLNSYHERHQKARDTRQDARTNARVNKRDCYVKDNKSNRDCRRDKADTKQQGRRDARDTLWGNSGNK
jgi:hypothetical protein